MRSLAAVSRTLSLYLACLLFSPVSVSLLRCPTTLLLRRLPTDGCKGSQRVRLLPDSSANRIFGSFVVRFLACPVPTVLARFLSRTSKYAAAWDGWRELPVFRVVPQTSRPFCAAGCVFSAVPAPATPLNKKAKMEASLRQCPLGCPHGYAVTGSAARCASMFRCPFPVFSCPPVRVFCWGRARANSLCLSLDSPALGYFPATFRPRWQNVHGCHRPSAKRAWLSSHSPSSMLANPKLRFPPPPLPLLIPALLQSHTLDLAARCRRQRWVRDIGRANKYNLRFQRSAMEAIQQGLLSGPCGHGPVG